MHKKLRSVGGVVAAIMAASLLLAGCQSAPHGLSKQNPQEVTVWHYYNGAQKQMFDEMVAEFNDGAGAEAGVIVHASSQGTVNELGSAVLAALGREVGTAPAPDIFAAYADTAYEIHRAGFLADLTQYFTEQELDAFVPAYVKEGEFEKDQLMMLPIAKSTEVFMLNKTDWDAFSAATGASDEGFKTWEGLSRVARAYYEWTDAQTDAPNDGRAFFGRDAMANYMLIGSMQLGTEMFMVDSTGKVSLGLNKAALRRLWDNYYVPYVSGYYAANGRFRSDDAKTGDIIAFVGATTGAAYFPKEVARADGTVYPIESAVYPLPDFEGCARYAVQQGAGMAVVKSDERREYASAVFLKWFTEPETNARFSVGSGYLPVKTAANDEQVIERAIEASEAEILPVVRSALMVGVDTVKHSTLYTSKPFEHGDEARALVASALMDKADEDLSAVRALTDGGMPRAQAIAKYDTDENFSAWFESFSSALFGVIGK